MYCHVCVCVYVQVYILRKDEGGRHTMFVNNYAPQLYTRTANVNASMLLPEVSALAIQVNLVSNTCCRARRW